MPIICRGGRYRLFTGKDRIGYRQGTYIVSGFKVHVCNGQTSIVNRKKTKIETAVSNLPNICHFGVSSFLL